MSARAPEAGFTLIEALVWHLLRDPSLGASLPAAGSTSWFVYRQLAAIAGVPPT